MKFLIVCALFPIALGLPSLLDEDQLKADILFLGKMFAKSELTRKACEDECAKYIDSDKELNTVVGCPLACAAIQNGLVKLVSEPDHSKRSFLSLSSLFDLESLKADLQLILDLIGSDATEQACEGACHHVLTQGHILNFGCPLVCHSFQKLIQIFHIHQDPTTTASP